MEHAVRCRLTGRTWGESAEVHTGPQESRLVCLRRERVSLSPSAPSQVLEPLHRPKSLSAGQRDSCAEESLDRKRRSSELLEVSVFASLREFSWSLLSLPWNAAWRDRTAALTAQPGCGPRWLWRGPGLRAAACDAQVVSSGSPTSLRTVTGSELFVSCDHVGWQSALEVKKIACVS